MKQLVNLLLDIINDVLITCYFVLPILILILIYYNGLSFRLENYYYGNYIVIEIIPLKDLLHK